MNCIESDTTLKDEDTVINNEVDIKIHGLNNLLEININSIHERINELEKKINNLYIYKNYQTDENRKVSRRMDELEDKTNNLLLKINALDLSIRSFSNKEEEKDLLTFKKAFEHFMNGKRITRLNMIKIFDFSGYLDNPTFSVDDIIANDWMVVD
ncbi:MAG TPA: hypothetical protein VK590_00285 [Saprospiraceae bacterium]|nr:hypothetical protein [Saprospiraceae bacterium]